MFVCVRVFMYACGFMKVCNVNMCVCVGQRDSTIPESPIGKSWTVRLATEYSNLAGQTHHTRLHVQVGQVYRLWLISAPMVIDTL